MLHRPGGRWEGLSLLQPSTRYGAMQADICPCFRRNLGDESASRPTASLAAAVMPVPLPSPASAPRAGRGRRWGAARRRGLVADLGLTVGHLRRVPLDIGVGGLGLVLLPLLLPPPLLGLDGDEAVGRDAVAAAQLPDGDLAGDVLALEVPVSMPRVDDDRPSGCPGLRPLLAATRGGVTVEVQEDRRTGCPVSCDGTLNIRGILC
jgi:hypothetical protein